MITPYYRLIKTGKDGTAGPQRLEAARDELRIFFQSHGATDGKPLIYIADPEITWDGERALVECVVLWFVRDKNGNHFRWRENETFELTKIGGKYIITNAKTTPLVMTHLDDPAKLRVEIDLMFAGELRAAQAIPYDCRGCKFRVSPVVEIRSEQVQLDEIEKGL